MFRLLYLVARQHVRLGRAQQAPRAPRRKALATSIAALALCAIAAGVAIRTYSERARAAPLLEPSGRSATLHIRLDAIDSAPVVVYLETPGESDLVTTEGTPETVRITSVNNAFEPAFQVAAVATRVEVMNGDAVPHNTHVFAGRRTVFNVATPAPGVRVQKVLGRSGILEARCDFHPWMHAWIFVPPNAHHAVIWTPGQATLPDIAPGGYRLHLWTPARGRTTQTLHFDAGETKSLAIANG